MLNVGEPVGATDDVERDALTEVSEDAEADVRGFEVEAMVDCDVNPELVAREDAALDSTEDTADEGADEMPDDKVDRDALEVIETTDDAAEEGVEAKEVGAEETGGAELGALDTEPSVLSGALDGAASTKDASWMRPSATRRPVESFMVSDVGVKRNSSAPPLSYTNQRNTNQLSRTRSEADGEWNSHQNSHDGDHPVSTCRGRPYQKVIDRRRGCFSRSLMEPGCRWVYRVQGSLEALNGIAK